MAVYRYAYYYAIIDLETGECIEFRDQTFEDTSPECIRLPIYNEDVICKFYYEGNWYEDIEHTIPWDIYA